MKDFAQIIIILTVIWGAMLAAPILGFILGCSLAAWIIMSAMKENKNGQKNN